MFISQMSPFSMNGLPSPGYQCPTSVYQPTSQQVYSLSQTGQQVLYIKLMKILVFMVKKKVIRSSVFTPLSLSQCTTGGLYSNVSFNNQSLFTQPRLAPQEQELQPKSFPKPIYSYRSVLKTLLKIKIFTSNFISTKHF